jgi:DNA repair protein RecO (recombination protein O)
MTLTEKEGYVVRAVNYRDSDQMISFLTEDGLVSFLARGVNKPTSKNAAACRLLAHSKLSLSTGKGGGLALSEGICLDPAPEQEDLARMAALTFLTEITAQMIQEDEAQDAYPWLEAAVENMRKGFDSLTSCLLLFAHYLILSGFGLNVDECVFCGEKRNIVGISYQDGGFVCRHCLDESSQEATPRKLKIIRYAFRCQVSDFPRIAFAKEECQELLAEWGRYLNELTGVTLKSLAIIAKI